MPRKKHEDVIEVDYRELERDPPKMDLIIRDEGDIFGLPRNRTETWDRRQAVAILRARGYSTEEIVEELERTGFRNPVTSQPWDRQTITRDYKELLELWRKTAAVKTGDHIARMLAELMEVKKTAWKLMDLTTVLLAIDREAKLLGLYAPTQHQIIVDERIKELAEVMGLNPDDLRRTAEAIAEGRTP